MSTANGSVHLDARRQVGNVDRRIFGGFLEHMGRAVYEGIYEPGPAPRPPQPETAAPRRARPAPQQLDLF